MLTQMRGRTPWTPRRGPLAWSHVWLILGAVALFCPARAQAGVPAPTDVDDVLGPERPPEPAKRPLANAIRVDPGATCLDHGQLVVQVESWLDLDDVDPRIHVVVLGDPARRDVVHFEVTSDGHTVAERRWDPAPDTCLDLHAVVGLAVAMALEAAVVAAQSQPPAPEPEPPEAEPTPRPPVRPSPEPPPKAPPAPEIRAVEPSPPTPTRRTSVALLFAGGLMVAPSIGLGGGGTALVELGWIHWHRLRFGALGGVWPSSELYSGSYSLAAVGGRLDTCFGGTLGAVRPNFCAGFALGSIRATGSGFDLGNQSVVLPWVTTVFGVELRVPVHPVFAFNFAVEALVALRQPRFDVVHEDGVIVASERVDPIGAIFSVGGAFTLQRARGVNDAAQPRTRKP